MISYVDGLFGRQGPAATLRQHCPQMTQRPGKGEVLFMFSTHSHYLSLLNLCLVASYLSLPRPPTLFILSHAHNCIH